jgi:phosphatidylserine/phosphatidylglycerophosphate/cardiolipin synthase-like enzyme
MVTSSSAHPKGVFAIITPTSRGDDAVALYSHSHVELERAVTPVKFFRWPLAAAMSWALLVAVPPSGASPSSQSTVARVWTEPTSGYGFLDHAIVHASRSVDLSMYELADTTLEHQLIARAAAGVDVRVLLDRDFNGARDNASSYALLRASRVHVVWSSPNQIFHAKYVVIDGQAVYLGTGNLASRDYATTRDFWVEDRNVSDVHAIASTFDNDFAHGATPAQPSRGLIWSPGSTATIVGLIGSARHSLLVENEEMDSAPIEQALDVASARGVVVKVVMTSSPEWSVAVRGLASDGVHVHLLGPSQLYIHAKVICVDCAAGVGTAFIGSENFSTSSLSYNRELGLVTTTPAAIRAVANAVNDDYATGTPVTSPPPTPTSTPSSAAVSITSFVSSITRGAEDSLSVHSQKADDSCSLRVVLPSGYVSQSHGLGAARANGAGDVTWTWEIGPNTDPGTARATVTCGAGSVSRDFTIT